MILQVGSNTWKVDDNWDTERLEGLLRSNTRKLQNLRGVQGSGGDNDLLGGKDLRRISASSSTVAYTNGLLALEKDLLDKVLCEDLVVGSGLDAVVTGNTGTASGLGLWVQDSGYPEDTNVVSR